MSDPDANFLHTFPQVVADKVKVLLPGLKTTEGMVGRFDLERLKKESVKTPGVLVSIVRVAQGEALAGPHHHFTLDMAAFVVTKDTMGLGRDEAAATIAQTILASAPDRRWGQDNCGEARQVRADPIVSAGFRTSKVSLWAVTWQQPCVLKGIPQAEAVPLQLYVGQSPDIGSAHEDDYQLIVEETP